MSNIKADNITNAAATGAPDFPQGMTIGGMNYVETIRDGAVDSNIAGGGANVYVDITPGTITLDPGLYLIGYASPVRSLSGDQVYLSIRTSGNTVLAGSTQWSQDTANEYVQMSNTMSVNVVSTTSYKLSMSNGTGNPGTRWITDAPAGERADNTISRLWALRIG